MSNLTVAIDGRVLKRARMRALDDGTSVNAVVRDYLERYAGVSPTIDALQGFLALAKSASASSGAAGRTWTRDEIHDRPNLR
jgi:hypothetical protein